MVYCLANTISALRPLQRSNLPFILSLQMRLRALYCLGNDTQCISVNVHLRRRILVQIHANNDLCIGQDLFDLPRSSLTEKSHGAYECDLAFYALTWGVTPGIEGQSD